MGILLDCHQTMGLTNYKQKHLGLSRNPYIRLLQRKLGPIIISNDEEDKLVDD